MKGIVAETVMLVDWEELLGLVVTGTNWLALATEKSEVLPSVPVSKPVELTVPVRLVLVLGMIIYYTNYFAPIYCIIVAIYCSRFVIHMRRSISNNSI